MNLTGIIIEIFETKTISEKFYFKEFVLKVGDGKYPDFILFQTVNQNTTLLDSFMENEAVTVYFTITGRKAKDRYWNSLKVTKIESAGASKPLESERERKAATEYDNKGKYPGGNPNDEFADAGKSVSETHPLPPDDGDLPF